MSRGEDQVLDALEAWEHALRDLITLVDARSTSTEALTRASERAKRLAQPALVAINSARGRVDTDQRAEFVSRAHQCSALISIAKNAAASQITGAGTSLERVRDVRRTLEALEAPYEHGSRVDKSG